MYWLQEKNSVSIGIDNFCFCFTEHCYNTALGFSTQASCFLPCTPRFEDCQFFMLFILRFLNSIRKLVDNCDWVLKDQRMTIPLKNAFNKVTCIDKKRAWNTNRVKNITKVPVPKHSERCPVPFVVMIRKDPLPSNFYFPLFQLYIML